MISYKGLLFSWMFAHPILIICLKYKCMHWNRASRKPLPRSQEQCLAPRNLYAAVQYARNRYDSPGWHLFKMMQHHPCDWLLHYCHPSNPILVRDAHSWDQTHLTHWSLGNLNEILDNGLFQLISVINGWGTSGEISTRWLSLDFSDDESILVQVMAWCRQATSHYLSHCWPRSVSPYGVIRPQWVNPLRPSDAYMRQ